MTMTRTSSEPGAPTPGSLTCPRDGAVTQLSCGRCATPICPTCLVRTSVGMRCPACAPTPAPPAPRRARRVLSIVVSLAGVAVLLTGGRLIGSSGEVETEVTAIETSMSRIGEEVTVGGFAVTVTSFACAPDDEVTSATPVQRCEATLQVRNDRFAVQTFPGSLQRVTNGFRRFVPSPQDSVHAMAPTAVDPGAMEEVHLVYRLAASVEPSRIELRASTRQAPVPVSLRA
jgi:hypothetical protein